jgi:hypothetical protein
MISFWFVLVAEIERSREVLSIAALDRGKLKS